MTSLRSALLLSTTLLACTAGRPAAEARPEASALPPPHTARLLTSGPEAFQQACAEDFARAQAARTSLLSLDAARQGGAVLEAYDTLLASVGAAAARASVARNAHPDAALRAAADACEQEAERLSTAFAVDRGLYEKLSAVDLAALDATTRHWVERTLRDMRRAGVDRDEATRARIQALNEELTRISQEFGRNIREDVREVALTPAQLAGMPEDYVKAHPPGADGKVRLTTDYPDYVPFLTYAKDAGAREALWRAYRQRGYPKNQEVLARLIEKRHALATLLGYPHWAAYVTETKMVKSEAEAARFIDEVTRASQGPAEREMAALLALKQRDVPGATRVEPWEQDYYEDRLKAERFGFDSQQARPYFEYSRVLEGVLDITQQLFGIRYVLVEDAPLWHPEVLAYDVVDETGPLGRVYLDMHPRADKYKHAAQFDLAQGQAGKRLPEGVLMCNFPRRGELMQPREVETFFHEFGHLLHHILAGRQRWAAQAGIKTEWDFVEAPSMLLQEWATHPVPLARFARHHQSGRPIPAELVQRMTAAKEFGKGLYTRRQMFLSAVSLNLYNRPAGFDPHQVVAELQPRFEPFRREVADDTWFELSFGHLDGYSAIYYTYIWSSVIAKDLLSVFEQEGMLSPAPALRYRRTILEAGGSRDAAQLVHDFLGRPSSFEAYGAWLEQAPTVAGDGQ